MSDTFAINSDYLKDFNSSCFMEQNSFCTRFMDEPYSYTARLKLAFGKENNKEDVLC